MITNSLAGLTTIQDKLTQFHNGSVTPGLAHVLIGQSVCMSTSSPTQTRRSTAMIIAVIVVVCLILLAGAPYGKES